MSRARCISARSPNACACKPELRAADRAWVSDDGLGFRLATAEVLERQMLAEDATTAMLPAARLKDLVNAALERGALQGARLRVRYAGLGPEAMAKALGLSVREVDEQPFSGPFLRYADYGGRPPEIRLFRHALALLDRLLSAPPLAAQFGLARSAPVFVAHELYHHLEAIGAEPPIVRRHAVKRLRVGRWELRAPVLAMAEIAAGACAQAMLGLKYHPANFDLVIQWHLAPDRARARTAALVQWASDASANSQTLQDI